MTKEKEEKNKFLKIGLSLGHQASTLISTPIWEHTKKSYIILKSIRA